MVPRMLRCGFVWRNLGSFGGVCYCLNTSGRFCRVVGIGGGGYVARGRWTRWILELQLEKLFHDVRLKMFARLLTNVRQRFIFWQCLPVGAIGCECIV